MDLFQPVYTGILQKIQAPFSSFLMICSIVHIFSSISPPFQLPAGLIPKRLALEAKPLVPRAPQLGRSVNSCHKKTQQTQQRGEGILPTLEPRPDGRSFAHHNWAKIGCSAALKDFKMI